MMYGAIYWKHRVETEVGVKMYSWTVMVMRVVRALM